MEIFTGLRAPPFLIRLTPVGMYKDQNAKEKARTKEILNIDELHKVLESVHKKVKNINNTEHARAQ